MKTRKTILLFCFFLTTAWCWAYNTGLVGDPSNVLIKVSQTQGSPRSSSILATIDGHTLSIVFLENLGQVHVEVAAVGGEEIQYQSTPTPNGVDFYITCAGNYIVTFSLSNGDVYYGEFTVTD